MPIKTLFLIIFLPSFFNHLALNVDAAAVATAPSNQRVVVLTSSGDHHLTRSSNDTSARITEEQLLVSTIFAGYNRYVRPVQTFTSKITIALGLQITQIFDLHEKNQVLSTLVWIEQEWNDEYLTWEPENYSGLEIVRVPSKRMWLPDIVLYNNAADFGSGAGEDTSAMIRYDGRVFWGLPSKLYSSCNIDVTYFPFDQQKCLLKFGSWTYDGFKVDLINRTDRVDLTNYMENGAWELVSADQIRNVIIYSCCEEPYPDVTFHLTIRRKTTFYVVNIFIPCYLMLTLSVLVFLLPPDSGEKVALGITVMLSFAVFMLGVIEMLPETSDSVPLISLFLSGVLSMAAISVIVTVIAVLRFHHSAGQNPRLSSYALKALRIAGQLCCTIQDPSFSSVDAGSTKSIDDDRAVEHAVKKLARLTWPRRVAKSLNVESQLLSDVLQLYRRQRERDVADSTAVSWRHLAVTIDRCLFYLFMATVIAFSLFMLWIAPEAKLLDGMALKTTQ